MRKEKKVRRKLLAVIATVAAAFFMGAAPAYADNGPHVSTATNAATTGVHITDAGQGRCASCHRAHTARAAFLLNAIAESGVELVEDSAKAAERAHVALARLKSR